MAQAKNSAPTSLYRNRRSFAKIPDVMDVPNLIAIQTDSFEFFKGEGLAQAFQDISPIENNTKDMCVEFGRHEFGEPKYTVDECKEKDVSYQAPLFVEIRFINRETGEIKEQDVFMGDFPLMTPRGTFIINGTERVVVSQLVRSPGVYFAAERDKTSDKTIYNAKVIPSRGAWLEFETDKRDILSVRIDRKRKQPATLLVRALGLAETREEIIELLGSDEMVLRTLDRDPATTKEESLIELYKRFRPGEPPTIDSARTLLEGLFFNPQRYDLAKVGRYKINKKLGFDPDYEASTLTDDDIVRTMQYIVGLHAGAEDFQTDDIDHFGNRRIRTVGELIQNQFRIGLSRMERVVRERMSMQEPDEITPQSLVNIRPIVAAIKEFFGSSQLSQFMDQTNPAAGITHKRRLSALGPGGLSRERAGFEVRDVHTSHYGRMCPIETPEGPNIGLIGSLATYARINPYGFIETPYRRVVDGKVTDDVDYLTGDAVGVIDIDGTIQYDGTTCSPEGLKAQLDVAAENKHIKAVVLRVNSGGGTATAGEEMAAYVRQFREDTGKPVVVSSASVNASAAYEISSQADYIYTAKTTAIGAIGTVMQVTDLSGLMEKLGISVDNIASADSKDSSYGTRPLTEEERAYYQNMVNQINETFIQTTE